MLKAVDCKYYKVKQGQTAEKIAEYFRISPRVLARENGLTGEPFAGQILIIPNLKGNAYTVREGDTKELLCGSAEGFERKNGTDVFYIGMRVIL